MYVISNFITAIAFILNLVLTAYMWILIARAIISWVNPDPRNAIVRFLLMVTEPLLLRLRNRFPILYRSGIDFSPMVVILIIIFLQRAVVISLYMLADSI